MSLVSSRINFKIPSAHNANTNLPSIQQQLAIVNNPILRQIYLTQRNVSNSQGISRRISNEKPVLNPNKSNSSINN